jgi:hypothetical protein
MAISLTATLLRFGAPTWAILIVAIALLLFMVPKLRRSAILEAASIAPLAGLLVDPHAWTHEAALMLPALAFAYPRRSILLEYALAPLWILSWAIQVNPVAIILWVESVLAYAPIPRASAFMRPE